MDDSMGHLSRHEGAYVELRTDRSRIENKIPALNSPGVQASLAWLTNCSVNELIFLENRVTNGVNPTIYNCASSWFQLPAASFEYTLV